MTTEVLGFLIIVGALIVFVMRRDLWSSLPGRADEVEEASVKMRLQMEHSADEIIARMESRIRHLENLVTTADERARVLEHQLAAARADQERAAMQAEQRLAAMRAAQDSYYMRGGPVDYLEPDARTVWKEGYYRPEPRTMRPVGGVSPVRRMETPRPRMIAPYDRGQEDFAETLSASMRAEESRYPTEYAQTVYARPETERYYETPYDDGYRGEHGYAASPRGERPQSALRASSWHAAAPVMDAEEMAPAERAMEETPAAVLEPRLSSDRRETYAEEPEDEPFFSEEALEELAHIRPEIVVSPSVADVVDLPLDPEEEESSAYSEGDTARAEDQESGLYDENEQTDAAYGNAPYEPQMQGARLHVAEGGEPLRAEPIYYAPPEPEPAPETAEEGSTLTEPAEGETSPGPGLWQEAEPTAAPETDGRPVADETFSQEPGEGESAAEDAHGVADASSAGWEYGPSYPQEPAGERLAPREPGATPEPGADESFPGEPTDAGQEPETFPEAEGSEHTESPLVEEIADTFVQGSAAYDTGVPPLDGPEAAAGVTPEPYAAVWPESDAERQAEPSAELYVRAPAEEAAAPSVGETQEIPPVRQETDGAAAVPGDAEEPPQTENESASAREAAASGGTMDWFGAMTADAEAADMELFEDGEPEEAAAPGPREASPAVRARELLAQGMTPTDVARETGMGRSAVELLTQMMGSAKSARAEEA